MQIRITRGTVAAPVGEAARAVEPGAVIEVDVMQGRQLIELGKAVLVEGDAAPAGVMMIPEQNLAPVQKRGKGRSK